MVLTSLLVGAALCVISETATVKLITPPEIDAKIGQSVTITCEFNDFGDDDMIIWKKGDQVLYTDGDSQINDERYELNEDEEVVDGKKISELSISALQIGDDSQILCGLVDPERYERVRIRVLVPPHMHISPEVWPYTVLTGDPVTLKCTGRGNPTPVIHWSKKGGSVSSRASIEGDTIRIPAVQREDAGIYVCYGNSTAGQAHAEIDMRVNDEIKRDGQDKSAPWIRTPHKYVPVTMGGYVNLTCQYDGNPSPQIEWSFNGYRLSLAKDIVKQMKQYAQRKDDYSETILEISSATADYFGDYSCKASNEHGEVATVIYLSAYPGPPSVHLEGTKLTMTVMAPDGVEEFAVFYRRPDEMDWLEKELVPVSKDDQFSTNSWRKSVDLKTFLEGGSYEIQVQARNTHGWGSTSPDIIKLDMARAQEVATASASVLSLLLPALLVLLH